MSELGTRYKCYSCSVKFYDLNRPLSICPSCGKDQNDGLAKSATKKKSRSFSFARKAINNYVPEEHNDLMEVDTREFESEPDSEDLVMEVNEDMEENTEMEDSGN